LAGTIEESSEHMDKLKAKQAGLERRQRRVRGKVSGTTLVAASTVDPEVRKELKNGAANIDAARAVGEAVGTRAKAAGVTSVIFDRGGRIYHGRVKALADGARSAGLEF
jgi:large subunit ribosomal protein L18